MSGGRAAAGKPQIRVIVQARTSSVRLPAKTLLPIAGVPLAVLAAKRLARTGYETWLATSMEPSDDTLAATAAAAGMKVFRGDLDDVLGRFSAASADLDEDAIVVRATGDNAFPDAEFAGLLISALVEGAHDIVGTRSPEDGLPYGLSLEVLRVAALRAAAREARNAHDREHVTPYLWRCCRGQIFTELRQEIGMERLRCTVDNFDDYLTVCRVFSAVGDPIGVGWRELVEVLARQPDAPPLLIPMQQTAAGRSGRLVLGTVQLGMPYGSTMRRMPPTAADAVRIVRRAISCGVTHLDTARAYGDSERRIGRALAGDWSARAEVVTKLDPLTMVDANAPAWAVEAACHASVLASCLALKLERLPTLLLHRAGHRNAWHGAAWRALVSMRNDGLIGRLGVSVGRPQDALDALEDSEVAHLQIPFNVLDTRWHRAGVPESLARRPDVIVHARSVLLQGVLISTDNSTWPNVDGLDAAALISWLSRMAADCGRLSTTDLCLSYARAQTWIHGVIVGVENLAQLDDTARMFIRPELSASEIATIERSRPQVSETLLDPSLWPIRG